ncbi:GNAT family N-acetyltransferase [Geomobilimonas luticola]|nr:GNAT family N-acetyltransferase [Geomobilimonas luticola]
MNKRSRSVAEMDRPEAASGSGDRMVDRFRTTDIDHFLQLAAREGWLCNRWELEFLLHSSPGRCFVVRHDDLPVAFVTTVTYGNSGWIGNLIVRHDQRGRGLGMGLMSRAIASLKRAGARTIWLTASPTGRPLYEKLGFRSIDGIRRWAGTGIDGPVAGGRMVPLAGMVHLDFSGWGDDRRLLLAAVRERGEVYGESDGFLALQRWPTGVQLGPWNSRDRELAATLLDSAMVRAGGGCLLFLDVPLRNLTAASLLAERGFTVSGSTTLMFRGEVPDYDPGVIFALASMGSMG